ncbi:MAG TPA: SDR family NAD(P)-dependent oxidoreductase [Gemmatimonadales bacterium]|nr:SDR family NAD(P)-dependent oxidoreductase [Gemmatimonadales bacterium]
MTRIAGTLALITGASSGIGAACARRFAAQGARLVLWARRVDRLETLAAELRKAHGTEVGIAEVDVRDREAVLEAGRALVESGGGRGGKGDAGGVPDILLNNAGLASGLSKLQEGDFEDWDKMIDTNIKGVLNVSRSLLPHMVTRGTGHVVNIGSTAGHMVYPGGNVYNATKYALRALNEGMNLDVAGTAIRVSSVDPGFVETEFSEVRFHGDKAQAKAVYRGFTPLSADDVADAIAYVVNLPPHVNILDLVMMPTAQRNIYVVDRAPERA